MGVLIGPRSSLLAAAFGLALLVGGIWLSRTQLADFEQGYAAAVQAEMEARLRLQMLEPRLAALGQTPAAAPAATVADQARQDAERRGREAALEALLTEQVAAQQAAAQAMLERHRAGQSLSRGYWLGLSALAVGALLTGIGLLGWAFNVRVIPDRRAAPRPGDG